MALASGFTALPQEAAGDDSFTRSNAEASPPTIYDVDARNHTQRSLNSSTAGLSNPTELRTNQVGTALSPITEHDTEPPRERPYDPADYGTHRTHNEYYGPDDLGRTVSHQGTTYSGADYNEWEATYKEEVEAFQSSTPTRPPNYKPCVFQLWFLAVLLFVVCGLLALAETAVHTLPSGQNAAMPTIIKGNSTELRPRGSMGEDDSSHGWQVRRQDRISIATRDIAGLEINSTIEVQEKTSTLDTSSSSSILLATTQSTSTTSEGDTPIQEVTTTSTPTSLHTSIGSMTSATNTTESSATSKSATMSTDNTTSVPTDSTSSVTSDIITTSTTDPLVVISDTTSSDTSRTKSVTLTETISTTPIPPSITGNNSTRTSTSSSGLVTCTVTVAGQDDSDFGVTVTKTIPVITVTLGGNYTMTPTRSSTSSKTTTLSKTTDESSCDVTVTITYDPPASTATGTTPPNYITIGLNTVTITPPGYTDPITIPPSPETPPEPTSTCYYRTVTQTEESNLIVKTVTVTIDVIVGGVKQMKRQLATPVSSEFRPYYERRACVDGGIFTVTEHLARPMTITETVWRTTTPDGLFGVIIKPPTTTTYIITTKGSTVSTTKTIPAITTTAPQWVPSGVDTTMKVTSTNADGEMTINTFTAVVLVHTDNVITSTSLIPVTTTDQNGSLLTTTKTKMVTQKPAGGSAGVATTTDRNGNTVVTTSTKKFSPLSLDNLEQTLIIVATTMTNSDGEPTLTTSALVWATPQTKTLTDSQGSATATETFLLLNGPQTTTFIDNEGGETSTATYYVMTSSITLTGSDGEPTATSTLVQTMTLSATTKTNSLGIPTKTETSLVTASFPGAVKTAAPTQAPTGSPVPEVELLVFSITNAEYVTGLIIPTLLATLLTLPIRILDHVAKLYHPFHILATAQSGASAEHSICWETMGLWTFVTRFQAFFRGEILLAITGLLVALAAILVPISAETVRIILHGPDCHPGQGTSVNCGITLAVFPAWSRAALSILSAIGVLILILAVWLWRFHRTGLSGRPWSLAALAGFSSNQDFQTVLGRLKHIEHQEATIKNKRAREYLEGYSYVLEHRQDDAVQTYAIVPVEDARHGRVLDVSTMGHGSVVEQSASRSHKTSHFFALTLWGRLLILLVLLGMLALIILYWALGHKTAFGRWMSSETVGVRILIVTAGMTITLFWSSYFYCKSISSVSSYPLPIMTDITPPF